MLVLSRRENETVLFPSLGISIEVVKTKANRVQLGIDAPREIRVIRGKSTTAVPNSTNQPNPSIVQDEIEPVSSSDRTFSSAPMTEVSKRLDAANLAIYLAQNQLRQGLNDHADIALDQAIRCLQDLEALVSKERPTAPQVLLVREPVSKYETPLKPVASIAGDGGPTELVTGTPKPSGYRVFRHSSKNDATNNFDGFPTQTAG